MDSCSDTEELRIVQIQLSHVVRYWLKEYRRNEQFSDGIGYEQLHSSAFRGVSNDKLDFLYNNENVMNKLDPTFKYGFNFTEIDSIRELSGASFLYMFTGIDYDQLDISYKG